MSLLHDTIFWVEVEKILSNPYQPRKEFDEAALRSLADSIKQYGVLQPLVVTRKEVEREDGGLAAQYELISGERRLRASKLAGIAQVPVVIRTGEQSDEMKLELAIIENLQREDLNPIDRAKAFAQLANDFGLKHAEIGKKVGKSREYVSNTIRILALPQEIVDAISNGQIMEGHARPLLMLTDRPEEQMTVFKDILQKRMTVRETERISRRIAYERARKFDKMLDPEIVEMEEAFSEKLGTRVMIERRNVGGKIVIDFFNTDDIRALLSRLEGELAAREPISAPLSEEEKIDISDAPKTEQDDSELYSVTNFTV